MICVASVGTVKVLRSLGKVSEMDSELSQISKIELFLKAFNEWKSLTIFKKASSYIFD